MTVEHLEILVEEPSMEAALRLVLPKMIDDLSFAVYPHQCKEDLLKHLPARLRAYAGWLPSTWRIVVIVDRDRDDCVTLKQKLDAMAVQAGLTPRSRAEGGTFAVINRLAIEELEAWFFGDWEAVQTAYPRVPRRIPAKLREPDAIQGGTWEALERTLQGVGYFKGGLRKIEAARTIAAHMVPERNCSPSFQALRSVLVAMTT